MLNKGTRGAALASQLSNKLSKELISPKENKNSYIMTSGRNALCCPGWLPSPKLYWLSFYAARKGFSPKRICQDTQLRLLAVTLPKYQQPPIVFRCKVHYKRVWTLKTKVSWKRRCKRKMLFQKRCQPDVWEFYRRAKKIGNSKLNFRPFKVYMLFHKGKFLQKFSILKRRQSKKSTALHCSSRKT